MPKSQNIELKFDTCDANNRIFPFGVAKTKNLKNQTRLQDNLSDIVCKTYKFSNQKEKILLKQKINILKNAPHKNLINIKSYVEGVDYFNIYYSRVQQSLESADLKMTQENMKELHKQLIKLAIHFAKNYILHSFEIKLCGIVFNENKFAIKYYLPLSQLSVSQNIQILERSVHIFKVKAFEALDFLFSKQRTDNQSQYRTSLSVRLNKNQKYKRQIEPETSRKNVSNLNEAIRQRRFSGLCDRVCDFIRKKSQQSTIYSQKNITELKKPFESFKMISENKKKCYILKLRIQQQVKVIKIKSYEILNNFELIKRKMRCYRKLDEILWKRNTS